MIQFNFPTVMFYGPGSIRSLPERLVSDGLKSILLVTDPGLVDIGLVEKSVKVFQDKGIHTGIYSDIHSNPIEEDVFGGVETFQSGEFDCIIALGGGSAIDVAKTIRFMVVHEPPLEQYDDAVGGDKLIVNQMPPMFAIPTTAGTGSEVGRSSVITLKSTGKKTIFFHPGLMPDIAVLDPELTIGLPPSITAATGIDAFTHCLEAYLVNSFHPMADAIALNGLKMVIDNLPDAVHISSNLKARGKMLLAASMGATAFQKGLGMIHSMAHPLSAEHNIHHGLANALLISESIKFTTKQAVKTNNTELLKKIDEVKFLFPDQIEGTTLHENIEYLLNNIGINPGLSVYGISKDNIEYLSQLAFEDSCHVTHPFQVNEKDFYTVYLNSL